MIDDVKRAAVIVAISFLLFVALALTMCSVVSCNQQQVDGVVVAIPVIAILYVALDYLDRRY